MLTAISPATTLSPDGRRILIDKLQHKATTAHGRGVTFSPTAFGRPHLLVVHAPGWRPVLQYPTAEVGLPHPVPLDLVQRRIDALVLHQLDLTVCARLGADFVEAILR